MTLTQLRYIVSIVDAGLNITKAGARVHATQPTISKQLKLLEGELGFRIFTRRGKSLETVTPAGRQVIDLARDVVRRARDIRSLAADLRGEARGTLAIVTTPTQARHVLPKPVQALRQRFPAVSVDLQLQADSGLLEHFPDGDADVALVSTSADKRPQAGLAVPIYRWSRVVVVPSGHALTRLGRPLQIADLAGVPLVSYDSSWRAESSLQQAFREAGLVPQLACTSNDAELLLTYVRSGTGVGIVAQMAALAQQQAGLTVLDGSGVLPECTTWLVLRRDRVVRSFVSALVQELAPHIDLRDVLAALDDDGPEPPWPEPPRWVVPQAGDNKLAACR